MKSRITASLILLTVPFAACFALEAPYIQIPATGNQYSAPIGGSMGSNAPASTLAAGMSYWSVFADGAVCSSAAVAEDGTVYFGSRDRHLYAIRPGGKVKWTFETGGGDSGEAAGFG